MKLDLSPLFNTSVGFDQLNKVLDDFTNNSQVPGYPPYNIIKLSEDNYSITIALAGFLSEDIELTLTDLELKISSKGINNNENFEYLYKGIANRAFERKFQLAENIKVNNAVLKNGMLNIDLIKTPPIKKKTKKIKISE